MQSELEVKALTELANAAAVKPTEQVRRAKRVPMSTPRRKLEVPEIPGYHCHWFLESNVMSALQGYYEHVQIDEVSLNQQNVATDSSISGSTDLGSIISILGNKTSESGKPEMLYLMKIKEEYYREDQLADDARDAAIMSGIFRDEKIQGSDKDHRDDKGTRYVKTALYQRPSRKG
jgi:hypothetical protein